MSGACAYCHNPGSSEEYGRVLCSDCASKLSLASEGVGLTSLAFYFTSGIAWAILAVVLLLLGGPTRMLVFACLLVPTWILWFAAMRAGFLDGFIWLRLRSPGSWWNRIQSIEDVVLPYAGFWIGLMAAFAVIRLT